MAGQLNPDARAWKPGGQAKGQGKGGRHFAHGQRQAQYPGMQAGGYPQDMYSGYSMQGMPGMQGVPGMQSAQMGAQMGYSPQMQYGGYYGAGFPPQAAQGARGGKGAKQGFQQPHKTADKARAAAPAAAAVPAPSPATAASAAAATMNPDAAPWQPPTHQASNQSKIPVVLLLGPPGSETAALAKRLADETNGAWYTSVDVRKKAQEERKRRFDSRPITASLWVEVEDALAGLQTFLDGVVAKNEAKGLFLDVSCRNNSIFHFIAELLRGYGMAPGAVFSVTGRNRDKLVDRMVADGEAAAAARKKVEHYWLTHRDRMAVFDGVQGLVTELDGDKAPDGLFAEALAATRALHSNVLSFALPYPSPASTLTPVLDIREYTHVMNTLCEKVAGGDVRYPAAREGGQLALVDDKLVNKKAAKGTDDPVRPLGSTHMASLKSNGTRYLMVYTNIPGNENRGRLYLVPKSMEMVFVFAPRIGDMILETGNAPMYGQAGRLTTWVLDGELVAAKTGWGGLKGMACKQLLYIAADLLYFAAEQPRDRFVNSAHWTLERRIEVLARLGWPTEDGAPHDTTNVSLCTKVYTPLHKLDALISTVVDANDGVTSNGPSYTVTGIVFTPKRRYVPYVDTQLCSWQHWKHKRVGLLAKEKQTRTGHPTLYELFAKKSWDDDTPVLVGEANTSEVFTGNVSCRVEWLGGKPGKDATKTWIIHGPASACWELDGVHRYLDPSMWIPPSVLSSELFTEPPKEPERKRPAQEGKDDEESEEEDE